MLLATRLIKQLGYVRMLARRSTNSRFYPRLEILKRIVKVQVRGKKCSKESLKDRLEDDELTFDQDVDLHDDDMVQLLNA